MFIWAPMLGDIELPGADQTLEVARPSSARIAPAFIVLALVAMALVVFLIWDFCRQKRVEKRERQRLQRFREKKMADTANVSQMNQGAKSNQP